MNKLTKDRLGGALLLATGAAAVVAGVGYGMGTLRADGLGLLSGGAGRAAGADRRRCCWRPPRARAGRATLAAAPAETAHLAGPVVQWRGWLCILGGALAFVVLGQHGGLVPASFVSVFVAALGDRNNSVRDAALLAALMTLLGVVVFHYGLHLLLPLFTVVSAMHDSLMQLMYGFGVALQPDNLMWCVFGVLVGNLIGVLPGMGPLSTISMLLPLDLRHRAGAGDPDAGRHLLRLAVRRRDRRDPAEPAQPSAACGDLPRRLSADAAGQGRHGAGHHDDGVVLRGVGGHRRDDLPVAAAGAARPTASGRPTSAPSCCWACWPARRWRAARR